MRPWLWLAMASLAAASGCRRDTDTDSGNDAEDDPISYDVAWAGNSPWTPVELDSSEDELEGFISPLIDGEDRVIPMYANEQDRAYAWRPSPPLSPGPHQLSYEDVSIVTTILPYGREDGFSVENIEERIYRVDLGHFVTPSNLAVALALVERVWLVIDERDEEGISFRLFVDALEVPPCEALSATGTLTETGELIWSADRADLETRQGTIPILNPSLHVGWLADGVTAGGVEIGGTLHTALISEEFLLVDGVPAPPDRACDQYVPRCYDCLGDGDYCVDIRTHEGMLRHVSAEDPTLPDFTSLPACEANFDAVGDLETSCDSGVSCSAVLFGMFGAFGWTRHRRRKRHGGASLPG
ncbi:MAG: hypothetical protein AAFV53_07320 [Myxococcota bacterium]